MWPLFDADEQCIKCIYHGKSKAQEAMKKGLRLPTVNNICGVCEHFGIPRTVGLTKYIITNIHNHARFPGIVYAEIHDIETNEMLVSADLDYCAKRIKEFLIKI